MLAIMALVQPIFNNAPARVAGSNVAFFRSASSPATCRLLAGDWFGPSERIFATSIASMSNPIGTPILTRIDHWTASTTHFTSLFSNGDPSTGIALGSVMPAVAVAAPADIAAFMAAQFYVCGRFVYMFQKIA
jgi:hypothetical protein